MALKPLKKRGNTMKTSPRVGFLVTNGETSGAPSWRSNKQSSTARGYGYKWQKARARFLQANPLCCFCERRGRITVATVVDHITPHRGDQELFWDINNWQPLCAPCHNSIKQGQENQAKVNKYL